MPVLKEVIMNRGPLVEREGHKQTTPEPGQRLRILMVEDDQDTVDTFAMLLTAEGYEVRSALDGPSGLEAARAWQPDAVLLDIGLPGMNGYELARQLRQTSGTRRPFLIAITAYGDDKARHCSEEVGIDLHLVKPVEIDDLQMVLDKFQTILVPEAG